MPIHGTSRGAGRRPTFWVAARRVAVAMVLLLGAGTLALTLFETRRSDFGRWEAHTDGHLADVRCTLARPSRAVAFMSGRLRLAGDLYLPATGNAGSNAGGGAGGPAVLLLHGTSPLGRRAPLVRVLAQQLRTRGFTVLAIDSRGYDDSDDPTEDTAEAFDFAADVSAALDSLPHWAPVDTSDISIVAHSFGAGVSLAAAVREPRIRRMVLIGPPRRTTERVVGPGAPDLEYFLHRWQSDMRLGFTLDAGVWRDVVRPMNLENYLPGGVYFPTFEHHVPLFFIDGEQEDPKDLAFLRDAVAKLPGPVDYWTAPGTGHYLSADRLSMATLPWLPERLASLPCYDRRIVDTTVTRIAHWLRARPTIAHTTVHPSR